MPIPQTVLDLIQRFEDNQAAYRSAQYNEAQVREEFITPFFAALGWDVYNQQGASEKYKEVVHEATVQVSGATKAPDYAFRLGGQRVFFVEAKKPAVALKDDPAPAYQLRRYAWSGKLALSLLTNFAEFAVYDCRDKPAQSDKAATGRIFYCTYRDYPEQWDYLAGILSPEAITQGAFDRYAEATRGKRGTAEVDAAFLAEIEGWRDVLARNIALRNPGLSARDLNFSVQQTIDRLIFLRIAEDRGIEPYQRLLDAAQGAGIYPRLCELFRQADNRYNSGLFHFQKEKEREETPDTFTLGLTLDDKVLKGILHSLYYPASPYQFDMLPADILGQVYEQFLGRVIRLTPGGQAKVEEKPEVKKAGGVYYTPTYIVDYIVAHTVGALLAGKTPQQVKGSARVAPLRILDPACGSGTFLIQAYQYLLDWYLEQYVAEGVEQHTRAGRLSPPFVPPSGGDRGREWRLTAEERKAILLRHLYGVDIDPQAVEVTKLSLLLKVLEGETEATLGTQLAMSLAGQDRVLPDLSRNIRCGNSLIGEDYYTAEQLSFGFVDEETRYRINAFDWEKGFHSALMAGGFDAVIGNPPYGASLSDDEELYLKSKYQQQGYQSDTYLLFIEKAISLLENTGKLGLIIPNTWMLNLKTPKIRKYLFYSTQVEHIAHHLYKVFPKATVDTQIVIVQKGTVALEHKIQVQIIGKEGVTQNYFIPQSRWQTETGEPVNILEKPDYFVLADRMRAMPLLDTIGIITQGAKPFQVGKGRPPQTREIVTRKPFVAEVKRDETFRPLLRGSLMQRYRVLWNDNYWISFGNWLAEPRYSANYDAPSKIVVRQTGDSLVATLDVDKFIVRDNLYTIIPRSENVNLSYVLGLINSKLLNWFYQKILNPEQGEALAQVKRGHLAKLPIRTIAFADPADAARHDRMVALVERMLELHRQLPAAKTQQAVRLLQQQIDLTDKAIDAMVYALYELTAAEIALVEGRAL